MADEKDIVQQKQYNELLREQKSIEEKIADIQDKNFQVINESRSAYEKKQKLLQEQRKIQDEILTLERTKLTEVEKIVESAKNELTISQENIKNIESQIEKAEELNDELIKRIGLLNEEIAAAQEKGSIEDEVIKKKKEEVESLKDSITFTREQIKELNKARDGQEAIRLASIQQKNSTEIISKNVANIGASLGLAASVNDTWLGKLQRTFDASVGIESAISSYGAAIADVASSSNIFASLISKMAESTAFMVAQTDSSLASFNQATGAGGRFNEQIVKIGDSNLEFGVGLQESAKAFEALHSNMASFTTLSVDMQNKAATLTTRLQGIGIAAEITATNLELATKSLGMTTEEAIASQLRIAELSEKIGVAPQKMASDFGAAVPSLAAYGPKMESVFVDLAKQAKATGIEMQSLITIAKQFDTFEGAATAAGKLNAILGGGLLNSVELLTASESERIAMLRETIEVSGRSWSSLNKFERMAIASAAGISDMTEASKLFGSTSVEFTKMQKEQKTLQERAEQSADFQKKLNNVMQMFSVMVLPLVNALHGFFNILFKINNTIPFFIPLLTTVVGLWAMWGKATMAVTAAKKAWLLISGLTFGAKVKDTAATNAGIASKIADSAQTTVNTAATEANAAAKGFATKASSGWSKALAANAANLVKLGFALLMAGTGIGLAAAGISLLAREMKGMGAESIALVATVLVLSGSMIGFVLALSAIAPVAAAIGPLLLPLGASILLFGSAIGVAAAGVSLILSSMSSLVDSFTSFFKIITDGYEILPSLASSVFLLSGALISLSIAGLGVFSIATAFGMLTAGVVSLATALALISADKLLAVSDIAKGLGEVSIDKSVAFKASMDSLEGAVVKISTIPPETMTNIVEFVRRISEVTTTGAVAAANIAQTQTNPVANTGFANARQSSAASNIAAEREIVLKIGEREFARAVINILNKEMKLNMVGG